MKRAFLDYRLPVEQATVRDKGEELFGREGSRMGWDGQAVYKPGLRRVGSHHTEAGSNTARKAKVGIRAGPFAEPCTEHTHRRQHRRQPESAGRWRWRWRWRLFRVGLVFGSRACFCARSAVGQRGTCTP